MSALDPLKHLGLLRQIAQGVLTQYPLLRRVYSEEDLVQHALVRLLAERRAYRRSRGCESTFVHATARRHLLNLCVRVARRNPPMVEPNEAATDLSDPPAPEVPFGEVGVDALDLAFPLSPGTARWVELILDPPDDMLAMARPRETLARLAWRYLGWTRRRWLSAKDELRRSLRLHKSHQESPQA